MDELVLSCEVGTLKPAPGIYQHALGRLGVEAADALMIDDQASYCAGAVAVGMRAAHLVRGAASTPAPSDGVTVVGDLTEAVALL